MPSLKKLVRRDPDRLTLKQRAAALRAKAMRATKRTLIPESAADVVMRLLPHNEGFVPFPATAPTVLMAIDVALPLEARRLLDIAQAEFTRLYAAQAENVDEATARRVAERLRRNLRIDALTAAAAERSSEPAAAEPIEPQDPVLTAIAASRAAEAAIKAWSNGVRGKRLTRADFADEQRLCGVQAYTRDAAFATVPTTRAGQLALVDYVQFQMGLHGFADGEAPDDDSVLWRDAYKALSAALSAPVDVVEPSWPDLTKCTTRQLGLLHEMAWNVSMHVSGEAQAPWCWNDKAGDLNAAGDILDAEVARWDDLYDAVAVEARRRVPADDDERDERLTLLVRHELHGGEGITNRALLAEAVAAWGDRARG